ncbi:unnamed protein product [Dicrocoelium dendriticum]|nr:unnamed protein product [Dicrocoelium dendriticum]
MGMDEAMVIHRLPRFARGGLFDLDIHGHPSRKPCLFHGQNSDLVCLRHKLGIWLAYTHLLPVGHLLPNSQLSSERTCHDHMVPADMAALHSGDKRDDRCLPCILGCPVEQQSRYI